MFNGQYSKSANHKGQCSKLKVQSQAPYMHSNDNQLLNVSF